jgi:hypothetical protein
MTSRGAGMRLTREEVLRRRLSIQQLTGPGLATGADVVELLACVQSQEWAHAFWSLGMRTAGRLGYAAVQREFDAGDFLRTHILRPTWHYVAPADIGWVLAATAARVHQRNQGMYDQSGLDRATRDRAGEVMTEALTGGTALTRPELAAVLAEHDIPAAAGRLAYLVMSAELDGLIASGPLRGAQHTYVRLDERLAGRQQRRPADPAAELLWRFLAGHGPASLADFTRWSSLSVTEGRAVLERLREQRGAELVSAEVASDAGDSASADQLVWWCADAPEPVPPGDEAFLMPLYDELTLSYPKINFRAAAGHPHVPGTDLFVGSVIIDDRNAGLWRRTVRGRRVEVALDLASSCSTTDRAAAVGAVWELAHFLGKELVQ